MHFPYTYIRCPCADTAIYQNGIKNGERGAEDGDDVEDDKTFDPASPRANFSLYPLDQLMWCDACHDIKCPRCTIEEVVSWYCPSCLFEVPSSMVKSEGNR